MNTRMDTTTATTATTSTPGPDPLPSSSPTLVTSGTPISSLASVAQVTSLAPTPSDPSAESTPESASGPTATPAVRPRAALQLLEAPRRRSDEPDWAFPVLDVTGGINVTQYVRCSQLQTLLSSVHSRVLCLEIRESFYDSLERAVEQRNAQMPGSSDEALDPDTIAALVHEAMECGAQWFQEEVDQRPPLPRGRPHVNDNFQLWALQQMWREGADATDRAPFCMLMSFSQPFDGPGTTYRGLDWMETLCDACDAFGVQLHDLILVLGLYNRAQPADERLALLCALQGITTVPAAMGYALAPGFLRGHHVLRRAIFTAGYTRQQAEQQARSTRLADAADAAQQGSAPHTWTPPPPFPTAQEFSTALEAVLVETITIVTAAAARDAAADDGLIDRSAHERQASCPVTPALYAFAHAYAHAPLVYRQHDDTNSNLSTELPMDLEYDFNYALDFADTQDPPQPVAWGGPSGFHMPTAAFFRRSAGGGVALPPPALETSSNPKVRQKRYAEVVRAVQDEFRLNADRFLHGAGEGPPNDAMRRRYCEPVQLSLYVRIRVQQARERRLALERNQATVDMAQCKLRMYHPMGGSCPCGHTTEDGRPVLCVRLR